MRQEALERYYNNPNHCLKCGLIIEVPDGGKVHQVRVKKFCGHACSATYSNQRRVPVRRKDTRLVCLVCSASLKTGKKYCSLVCDSKRRRQESVERARLRPLGIVKSPSNSHRALRRMLFDKKGAQCWKCGWNVVNPVTGKCPLVMNHIDGNSDNNVDSNLELICPNCDSLTPTYKALNRGKGRHSRRERYRLGKSY